MSDFLVQRILYLHSDLLFFFSPSSCHFIPFVHGEEQGSLASAFNLNRTRAGPWRPSRNPIFCFSDEEVIIAILPPVTPLGTVKLAHAFPRLLRCEEIGQGRPIVLRVSVLRCLMCYWDLYHPCCFVQPMPCALRWNLLATCYLIECLLLLIEFVYSRSGANCC